MALASTALCTAAQHGLAWRRVWGKLAAKGSIKHREERVMRGVVFVGDRKLEIQEFPDPTPGPREVVLEIKASGMCGSDLHQYRRTGEPGAATGGIRRSA